MYSPRSALLTLRTQRRHNNAPGIAFNQYFAALGRKVGEVSLARPASNCSRPNWECSEETSSKRAEIKQTNTGFLVFAIY